MARCTALTMIEKKRIEKVLLFFVVSYFVSYIFILCHIFTAKNGFTNTAHYKENHVSTPINANT